MRKISRRTAAAWAFGVVPVALAAALAVARLTPSVPITQVEHVHGLAVDPNNPRVLWIGTHDGLVRVVDGQQWRRIGRQRFDMMGFTIVAGPRIVMLTSGHPGPEDRRPGPLGLEISRNGGRTWQTLSLAGKADFHALAIARTDPRILYAWNVAEPSGLYRSRDGGVQWEFLGDRGLGDIFYLATDPHDPSIVFAGTSRGLYRTADAGGTWRLITAALAGVTVTAVEVHPLDPHEMYAYAMSPALGLIRSEDEGRRWIPAGFYLGKQDAVSNLALDPQNSRIIYMATYGGDIFRSTDGGKTREGWLLRGKVVMH